MVDSYDYSLELTRGLASAWEVAKLAIGKVQSKQKLQYDRRTTSVPQYAPGGRVMIYMPREDQGKERKLALPNHGPFHIVDVRSNTLFVRLVDKPGEEPIHVNMYLVHRNFWMYLG